VKLELFAFSVSYSYTELLSFVSQVAKALVEKGVSMKNQDRFKRCPIVYAALNHQSLDLAKYYLGTYHGGRSVLIEENRNSFIHLPFIKNRNICLELNIFCCLLFSKALLEILLQEKKITI